jgi:uncharacterized repeat protein (TIGR03803 family)
MRAARFWSWIVTVIVISCAFANGQAKHRVLYSFGTNGGVNDGWLPNGELVFDAGGNIYGTTSIGGMAGELCSDGCGTVFELSPISGGGWSESIIHVFSDDQDGMTPLSGLILGGEENLYGTTEGSGNPQCQAPDCGTVFELSPSGNGAWTETVLYAFTGVPDGQGPLAPLIFDAAGNLYGTTGAGGVNGYGTAFELSPPLLPGGTWTEKILYSFCQAGGGKCSDGAFPDAGLVFDGFGNLYGTTTLGAIDTFWGLVYELSPSPNGSWTETALYKFDGTHGGESEAGLTFDASGNLYGTMEYGGSEGPGCFKDPHPPNSVACGGVFRLAPRVGGGWTEKAFLFDGTNGGNPIAGVIVDGDSVYGTTYVGGNGYGTIFEIKGTKETVIYIFCSRSNCIDGSAPFGTITLNGGQLFGTTQSGGLHNQGTVFSVAP